MVARKYCGGEEVLLGGGEVLLGGEEVSLDGGERKYHSMMAVLLGGEYYSMMSDCRGDGVG